MKVVIQRSQWLHAKFQEGQLRSPDGKMCAVGFVCVALGVPPEELNNRLYPSDIASRAPQYRGLLDPLLDGKYNNATARRMLYLNDTYRIGPTEREAQLIDAAREINIDLEFED